MSLISPTQLAAIRKVAYRGLETEVAIMRAVQVETDFGSEEAWATVAITDGWIREMSVNGPTDVFARIAAIGTHRLHVRVDVDIRPGDRAYVNDEAFTVAHVNEHNTIKVFMTASLRRVE